MNPDNLLPKPVHIEEVSRKLAVIERIEPTNDISKVLTPEQAGYLSHHIGSEAFQREGYVLGVRQTDIGHVINVYSTSAAGNYYGKNTARRIVKVNNGNVPDIVVVDYPAFPIRGAIEGFYGMPWTWQERTDIVEAISQVGYNAFVFAPPDINLKVNWRELLPDNYQSRLEHLISHAHKHHVKFVYEILPIGINLGSGSEYKILLERCKEMVALGADAIMVAFDDTNDYEGQHVKKEKAALGQAQLLNNLLQQIGNDKLFLCLVPVEYYGVRPNPYLTAIGKKLDPAVYVGWSGRKIRSPTVTKEDALRFGEIIQRKPFLGHNFPVVDEMRKKRRLTISPLTGLESTLSNALSGIAFNFMELPYASLVSGHTAGDFAWNPSGYYANRSMANSVALHGKNLMKLAELNPESYANPNEVPKIAVKLRQQRLKDLSQENTAELRKIFRTMVDLDELMSEGVDPRIYREIRPWLAQGNLVGALGNLIVDKKIETINWKARTVLASKMVSGYRLGGLAFEDWILRELGFPANLFYYAPSMRLVADFFETVARKRHQRQLNSIENEPYL